MLDDSLPPPPDVPAAAVEPINPYPALGPEDVVAVFVGGGACGEWPAGAVSAAFDAGVLKNLKALVGTSVGGLNACCIAMGLKQGKTYEVLRDAWANIKQNSDIYTPDMVAISSSPWLHTPSIISAANNFFWGPGLLDTGALYKLAERVFGDTTAEDIFKACGISVYTRAFHYETGVVHTLTGRLADMALCTSAIEGAFPAYLGYGDGGVGDNCPIDIALDMGAKRIAVFYCTPESSKPMRSPVVVDSKAKAAPKPRTGIQNIEDVVSHIVGANEDIVTQAAQKALAAGVQIIEFYPTTDTGNFLDFRKRGLWDRGAAESYPGVESARMLGWIQ